LLAGAALAVPPTVVAPTPDQVFDQGDTVILDAAAAFDDADLARRLSRAADGEASSESGAIAEAQAALDACRGKFEDGMNDDLNTPTALAALHELRGAWLQGEWGSEAARAALEFLHRADEVLGVIRWEEAAEGDAEIQSLVDARDQARADKNWAEADRLRDELQALGIVTEDGADGTVWFRK